jgi:hypothetical protein
MWGRPFFGIKKIKTICKNTPLRYNKNKKPGRLWQPGSLKYDVVVNYLTEATKALKEAGSFIAMSAKTLRLISIPFTERALINSL